MTALYGKGVPRSLAGLEAQHTAALAACKPHTAGGVRLEARALAAKLGAEIPAWAAIQPRGSKTRKEAKPARPPLEERYAAAIAAGELERAKHMRRRARAAATRDGVPIPAWAAPGSTPAKAPPAQIAKPARPKPEKAALRTTIAEYVAQPVILPSYDGVRAWAQSAPVGMRALSLRPDGGVTLISWHDGPRLEARFASEADALASIASGAIAWVTPRKRKPSGWRSERASA